MSLKDLFDIGEGFISFLDNCEEVYRSKIKEIMENMNIEENTESRIRNIDKNINILAFAEAWCPDCQINLPPVYTLTQLNENIKLSIVPREGNEEALSKYKVNGKPKIPTFIIMDAEFNVLGAFVEIPNIIKEVVTRGNQPEIIVTKRKYRKGEYCKDTVLDIIKIIGQ
ncbi:thioredoxin family protein [Alkalithermobacter paradoxus]|uniref:Thioredoxin n=1 Tax=Alkalithermobacter paradoxus TaxID=29349 RepID=A0A1V4I5U1_9FIRM|nr:hypothetical protein CLOTH_19020 [[Clostridium] thermoalcaliphilum]